VPLGGGPDTVLATVEVVTQLAGSEAPERAVRVTVQADRVARGLDLVAQRAAAAALLADQEERGSDAVLAQQLEHPRRGLRVRAVVEGQVRAGQHERRRDAERASQPRHVGRRQGQAVGRGRAGGDGERGAHGCEL
jgi:hypothetical protein